MIPTTVLFPLLLSTLVSASRHHRVRMVEPPQGQSTPPPDLVHRRSQGNCANYETVYASSTVTRIVGRGWNTSLPSTTIVVPPEATPTATAGYSPQSTYVGSPPSTKPGGPASGYRNVLYFTNWGIYPPTSYGTDQIPADKVTHLLYAFTDIVNGEVVSNSPSADFGEGVSASSAGTATGLVGKINKLKKQYRKMKVILSIGGWNYSQVKEKFPESSATEERRQRFVKSAINLMQQCGFDGIDVDWEYPQTSTEAQNFVLLLKGLREGLDAYARENAPGYHFALTVASPAGPDKYTVMDLKGMDRYLDAWHLMAYDYAGGFDPTSTGHQANLYKDPANPSSTKFNTDDAVKYYISQNIAPSKIVLGMPLYGRAFLSTSGMGKPFSGVGDGTIEQGVWNYNALPKPGAVVQFDRAIGAAWSYDAAKRELVSFDTVESAVFKTNEYMKPKGLGGAMFWEASGDGRGDRSIVGAVAAQMGKLDATENLLVYPKSTFSNIRGA
ncbi:Endochitinase 42 [Colletotrichum orbiculare MAFF 240422]|uniref:chitinase n=1 Tax=Colletotrichum orbiculare (strain 104-T / ATCC 96160 / CBS 514.97 / LARS 414 / MAFF 240422) TaxID=1213857 RepID=A0A484G7K2_COLOR|nr:Endochitinase 42 [Colletotrichum orbiculare MAFF 240422]